MHVHNFANALFYCSQYIVLLFITVYSMNMCIDVIQIDHFVIGSYCIYHRNVSKS